MILYNFLIFIPRPECLFKKWRCKKYNKSTTPFYTILRQSRGLSTLEKILVRKIQANTAHRGLGRPATQLQHGTGPSYPHQPTNARRSRLCSSLPACLALPLMLFVCLAVAYYLFIYYNYCRLPVNLACAPLPLCSSFSSLFSLPGPRNPSIHGMEYHRTDTCSDTLHCSPSSSISRPSSLVLVWGRAFHSSWQQARVNPRALLQCISRPTSN